MRFSNTRRSLEPQSATPQPVIRGWHLGFWLSIRESEMKQMLKVAQNNETANNGLHQTGRGGVALASRLGPVVEARPAGEAGCCTDSSTNKTESVSLVEVARSKGLMLFHRSGLRGVGFNTRGRSALGPCSTIACNSAVSSRPFLPQQEGGGSTNFLTQVMRSRALGLPAWSESPYNNGLHQTGRGGVALASRRGPVVEARPAGEAGCSTDLEDSERPV